MEKPILPKVIIADDHELFRKGLIRILEELALVEVVGEAVDGRELLSMLKTKKPDLVLVDINMPSVNGIEATSIAHKLYPAVSFVALSMFDNVEYYEKMIEAGVVGYILKNTEIDELEIALKTIINGGSYFSQQLLQSIVSGKNNLPQDLIEELNISKRELEVLAYVCKGFSNKDIAEKLFIEPRTIERHKASLMRKTQTSNTLQLVLYALKTKLIVI